jgi:hypothetical protein
MVAQTSEAALFPGLRIAVGDFPRSVAVADLDGDTVPDLVTANIFTDTVSVLLGNGDGSFQAAAAYAAGDNPQSVAVADLDGDTVPDLVTANSASNDVSVLLGNGDGTFRPAPPSRWAILPVPWPWPTSTATPSPTWSPLFPVSRSWTFRWP